MCFLKQLLYIFFTKNILFSSSENVHMKNKSGRWERGMTKAPLDRFITPLLPPLLFCHLSLYPVNLINAKVDKGWRVRLDFHWWRNHLWSVDQIPQ